MRVTKGIAEGGCGTRPVAGERRSLLDRSCRVARREARGAPIGANADSDPDLEAGVSPAD